MINKAKSTAHPALMSKILPVIEIIALVGAGVGVLFRVMHYAGADEILMLAMSVLAAVYFQMAFYVFVHYPEGSSRSTFVDLFVIMILPKVLMIASSAALVGSLFRILHLHGSSEMLMIGSSILVPGNLAAGYFFVSGKGNERLRSVLIRTVPVCLLGIHMWTNVPA